MNRHPPRPPQQQETKNLKAPLLPNARGYGSAQRSRLPIHTQLKSTATQSHAIKHKSATAHTESVIEKIKKKATECSGKIQGGFFRRDKILKHSLDIYLQAMWYHDTANLKDFLVVEGVFNAFKRRLGIELRDELVKEHQIAANFVFDFGSFITDAKETDGNNHYRRIVMHAEEKLAQIQKPILRGEFPLVEYLKLANSALTSGATARKCLFKGIISSMNLLIRQGENGSRSFEFPKDLGEKYQKGVRELEEAMISEYLYQAVLLAGVHGAHRLSLRIIKQQPITAIVALKHPSLSAREYWHQDQTSLFRLATGLNPDCLYGSKELPAQDIVDTRRSAIVEVQADRPGRIERAIDTKLPTSRKTQFARSPSPVESGSGNFALVVYRNDADTKKLRVEFNKRWTLQLEEKPPEQVLRTIQGQRKCRYCYISTS